MPDSTISFEMDEPTAAFRVNREKRTISGLLVPWGKVGMSGGAPWSFAKDSLHWTEESRIKLNNHHDRKQAVGVAARLQATPSGLDGSFRIARGEEGDKVLSLAEDGVLDGFSIEVAVEDGDQAAFDAKGVTQVARARLRGVAITAFPAFDDARVTHVAASREGVPMSTEPSAPEAPASGPDTASFTSAVEAFTAAVGQLAEIPEQRQVVDPTRRTAQFEVNEDPLYRFDGLRGDHDFSTDMIAGAKGDGEALNRVQEFMSAEFAVTQANVAPLNPDRQRPDLYVDQLDYVTPVFDSINKGAIADNTPFVLPKFASSAGLVGDHTEGVEPTPGSLTAGGQTITPSAVSGKIEVTREAFDQGGNPQLSGIIWKQMRREWREALEAASVTMLNGLTVAEVTLTAGAVNDALASELEGALADLQFVRGGMRLRDFKVEKGLYKALTNAVDSTGRKLYPTIGASNATGTTSQFFGSIDIAGLLGVPAWALPAGIEGTPDIPGKSYLYNRDDVHAWASTPQRLEFQYQVKSVEIGLWGYKALAATRTDGVRRINYDTTAA